MKVKIINKSGNPAPEYAKPGDSGMDLRAYLPDGPVTLKPLERKLIHTGIYVCIPEWYEIQIRPRSGAALKYGLTVINTPGTIDSSYRKYDIGIIVINLSSEYITIDNGDRIAQMVLMKIENLEPEIVDEFTESDLKIDRGGGYGHTGIN